MRYSDATARDQAYQAREKDLADLERRELTLLAESAGWPRWAAVAARFPLFRAGDHVMVLGQRPQAQLLLSPQQWRDVGRWPKRGEEPVRLWRSRPVRYERGPQSTRMVGGWAPVYDVDQTEGEPLIMMPRPAAPTPGRAPRGMGAALGAVADVMGFAVRLRPVVSGHAPHLNPTARIITTDPAGDDASHCAALLQRITAAAAADTSVAVAHRDAVGAATAAVVWATYHQPAPSAVRPDPKWRTDHEALRAVLATVTDLAGTITATLATHAVGTAVAVAGDPMPPPPKPAVLTGPGSVAHV